jgi:hypothetical protein
MLLFRKEDFDDLLDRSAERGAERVLAHLGLENGHAARDIRELRGLIEACVIPVAQLGRLPSRSSRPAFWPRFWWGLPSSSNWWEVAND